jgi:polysaccharide pyruvyl transferase CsaB
VLSADPQRTAALHAIDAWPRAPAAVWRALSRAQLLISGGGSLVQDVTSARSALYYLGVITAASARRVPVAVIGQGIGPIRRPWLRRLTRSTFDRAGVISVRDADSAQMLRAMGVSRPLHLGADLAALMHPAPPERIRVLLAGAGLDAVGPRLGVAVRAWPGPLAGPILGAEIRRFAAAHGAAIAVFPFDNARDWAMSEAVAASAGGRLVEVASPQDLLGLIGAMDLVVAVRLHALVFAALQAVPAVGVAYDPKVAAFAAAHGLPSLNANAQAPALGETLAATWGRRREINAQLQTARHSLQRAASEAIGVALQLVSNRTPASRQEFSGSGRNRPGTGIS